METYVNYNETAPIDASVTVAVVNSFVISSVKFLNKFSFHCEAKIAEISRHLTRLETQLTLLEAKLNSVPELGSVVGTAALGIANVPPPSTAEEQFTFPEVSDSVGEVSFGSSLPMVTQSEPEVSSANALPQTTEAVPSGMVTNDKNPLYARYFRLLNFGARIEQLRQQVIADGLDPAVLENPKGYGKAPPGYESAPTVQSSLPVVDSAQSNESASLTALPSLPSIDTDGTSLPSVMDSADDNELSLPEVENDLPLVSGNILTNVNPAQFTLPSVSDELGLDSMNTQAVDASLFELPDVNVVPQLPFFDPTSVPTLSVSSVSIPPLIEGPPPIPDIVPDIPAFPLNLPEFGNFEGELPPPLPF